MTKPHPKSKQTPTRRLRRVRPEEEKRVNEHTAVTIIPPPLTPERGAREEVVVDKKDPRREPD
jgi:hypothetical protein